MTKKIGFFFFFILICGVLSAQQVEIEYGKNKLNVKDIFQIKLTLKSSSDNRPNISFPIIEGLQKIERPVTTNIGEKNGQVEYSHVYIQKYKTVEAGNFRLKAEAIVVLGKAFQLNEVLIMVVDPNKPIEEIPVEEVKSVKSKQKAELKLEVNKNEVFKGESFKVAVVLLISNDNNTNYLSFPADASKQIQDMLEQLKPKDCIEFKSEIKDVTEVTKVINGKEFKRYLLFETSYMPIKEKSIELKPLNIVMQKNEKGKISKFPISSLGTVIDVKKLPEHPLKNNVVVGNLSLEEELSNQYLSVGNTVEYSFAIKGTSNFNLITMPELSNDIHFDFYPIIVDDTGLSFDKLTGKKIFKYSLIPKSNGVKSLEKYINFVYFNDARGNYDTLFPKVSFEVSGKNMSQTQTKVIEKQATKTSIYDGIESIETSANYFDYYSFSKKVANIAAIILSIGLIVLLVIRKKS